LTDEQDLEQIEEWNEFGELKQQIAALSDLDDLSSLAASTTSPPANVSSKPPTPAVSTPNATAASKELGAPKASSPHIQIQNPPATKADGKSDKMSLALRQAGEEAALKAKAKAKLGTKPATTEGPGKQVPAADPKAKGTEPATIAVTPKRRRTVNSRKPRQPANLLLPAQKVRKQRRAANADSRWRQLRKSTDRLSRTKSLQSPVLISVLKALKHWG
jgi:hypothetical protein